MSDREHVLSLGRRLSSDVLGPIKQTFVGKEEVVDLMGVCLVGSANLFLFGPPGTAKSALVQELGRNLDGQTFDYLLTRFTEPNEIFGPFDIRKLREGELVTNTEGMLPEATFVFLDELLNANSAILNSLLMALNERVFRRGRETRSLPALMFIGASNRLPEDEALQALFDRFLLRVRCENVGDEKLGEVLQAGWRLEARKKEKVAGFSVDDVRVLQAALRDVDLSGIAAAMVALVLRLRRAGLAISDRRAVQLQRMVAASALICGRSSAQISDFWVFRYIWDTLDQQEVLNSIVEEELRREPASPADHPRARNQGAPDPEALARDLDGIATRLAEENLPPAEHEILKDRLGILAARCQWVASAESRAFLDAKADQLWKKFEAPAKTLPPESLSAAGGAA